MLGFGCLVIAGIFMGAFVSGDANRANFNTESKEDRNTRTLWSMRMFLFGLPNVIAVVIVYLVTHH